MTVKYYKNARGMTLVEAMVAMVVLSIATLGALAYQYHAAQHARIAKSQMTATRTAQLLLEDWKSTGGTAGYDPTALGLNFASTSEVGFDYFIIVDDLPMYVSLSRSDIAQDTSAGIILRRINVTVRWRGDYTNDAPGANDPSLVMTTYVRVDASGG